MKFRQPQLNRIRTILLAVLVFVANAYCACANGASQSFGFPATVDASASAHGGCHGQNKSAPTGGDEKHGSHSCAHCTGTAFSGAPAAKAAPPAVLLAPVDFAVLTCAKQALSVTLQITPSDHCGLSPPLRPTLLNLACSLNT